MKVRVIIELTDKDDKLIGRSDITHAGRGDDKFASVDSQAIGEVVAHAISSLYDSDSGWPYTDDVVVEAALSILDKSDLTPLVAVLAAHRRWSQRHPFNECVSAQINAEKLKA